MGGPSGGPPRAPAVVTVAPTRTAEIQVGAEGCLLQLPRAGLLFCTVPFRLGGCAYADRFPHRVQPHSALQLSAKRSGVLTVRPQ